MHTSATRETMDALIECISRQIGPKWVQLYSRLGLGARERYKFSCSHQSEPEEARHRKCALDTLVHWRSSLKEVEEGEAMRRLLTALRKVQGFEGLADELGHQHGIVLEEPFQQSESVSSVEEVAPSTTGSAATTPSHPAVGLPTSVDHHSSSHSSGSVYQDDDYDSSVTDTEGQQAKISHTTQTSELLHISIDLRETRHKFALLDISQRLKADKWNLFAKRLGLSPDEIDQLSQQDTVTEERYYKTLKTWLGYQQDSATFATLQEVLKWCNQSGVITVMLRRLQSERQTL